MAVTTLPVGSPQAVQRWALSLSMDYMRQLYWRRFTGRGMNNIVEEKTELESSAGDKIVFDLNVRLKGEPTKGDNRLEGREEQLRFYQDELEIDQLRHAVSAGGRMSQQRTVHDLRTIARARLSEYLAEWSDELMYVYGSGKLGATNDNALVTESHAGNAIQAADAEHTFYGFDGSGTAPTALTEVAATDIMSLTRITQLHGRIKMLNTVDKDTMRIKPVKVNGSDHYVMLISPAQETDLKTKSGTSEWLAVQANANRRSDSNPIFTGSIGMIDGIVIHSKESVRLYNDGGSGAVNYARALVMGAQAMTCAYGGANSRKGPGAASSHTAEQVRMQGGQNSRLMWEEEWKDFGNEYTTAAGMIFGCKKTRYNGKDYGMVAFDTAYSPV